MKVLYLAHNFNDRKLVRKWELKIEEKYNVKFDNPFYDHRRNDIEELDKIEAMYGMEETTTKMKNYFKERNTPEMVNRIVEGDLESCNKADGLITLIKNASLGTPMEVFYVARILRKPVYVITKRYAHHPWILKFATRIFADRREFEKFIGEEFGVKK